MQLEDFLKELFPNNKLEFEEEELEIMKSLLESININLSKKNNNTKEEQKINRNEEIKQIINAFKNKQSVNI